MKKTTLWAVIALISILLNAYLIYKVVGRDHSSINSPDSSSAQEAGYVCPMHPQVTSDWPADCPICAMKLVKRPDGMDSDRSKMPYDDLHRAAMAAQKAKGAPTMDCEEEDACCAPGKAAPAHDPNFKGARSKSQSQNGPEAKSNVSYTCPMHPEYISDKSGRCPKCKMFLAEKEM